MKWFWYISLAFLSAVGFGLAAFYAEGGKALVGMNTGLGVFCCILALVAGIKHAITAERNDK